MSAKSSVPGPGPEEGGAGDPASGEEPGDSSGWESGRETRKVWPHLEHLTLIPPSGTFDSSSLNLRLHCSQTTIIFPEVYKNYQFIYGISQMKKSQVQLRVNNRDIPLNPFLSRLFSHTIIGMVSSLKGVAAPRKIELRIESPGTASRRTSASTRGK